MIEQVFSLDDFQPADYYGRKLISYYEAFGAGYNFCRFYRSANEEKAAFICVCNDTLLLVGSIDFAEFSLFVKAIAPAFIESSCELEAELLPNYERTEFKLFELQNIKADKEFLQQMKVDINPPLNEVYEILKQGFDLPFEEWLCDTSHRVRHGKATIFRYKSTVIVEKFCVHERAFYCQLATSVSDRGKGQAVWLLGYIAERARSLGIAAELSAIGGRYSFYEGAGARAVFTGHSFCLQT